MPTLIEALDTLAAGYWREWKNPAWKQFILSGDTAVLQSLSKFSSHSWLPPEILAALPLPDRMDTAGVRFFQACLSAGFANALGFWMRHNLADEASQNQHFSAAVAVATQAGFSKTQIGMQVAEWMRPLRHADDSPTAAGKFLLGLERNQLREILQALGHHPHYAFQIGRLFVSNNPAAWKAVLETFRTVEDHKTLHPHLWATALSRDPEAFLETAARSFEQFRHWQNKFDLGKELYRVAPDRFGPVLIQLSVESLEHDTEPAVGLWHQAREAGCWLIANRGLPALGELEKYFAKPIKGSQFQLKEQSEYKNQVLSLAAERFKRDALPLFEAVFAVPQPEVQLQALKLWAPLKTESDQPALAPKLRQLFADDDSSVVSRAARLAGDLYLETVEDDVWSLFSHKSRPVRDAASQTLARLGDSRLARSKSLWAARRADARIAAVNWLKALGTPGAISELKSRLDAEEDDNVRDAILLALEKLSGAAQLSAAELRPRIEKTLAKLQGPPVPWLDVNNLPVARLKDGSALPAEWLLYLLYRQSRVKEMRADLEGQVLYQMIDRKSSGDLALEVLRAFFASKGEADDRWTMAFAALLGDDRLVPVFSAQIKAWADSMRGKLAEYAVLALALLGSDVALLTVDAMAIRYRSKNKNIGKAATEAFAAAAERRGLTVEELGDLVVPWLGFTPGEPRVIETGKGRVEVQITNDFKLAFGDAATRKKIAKLPDSVSAEVKAEFKELAAALKEAVKSQLLRMETLMVRQFRWPAKRWSELYLQHPLLLPFAQRLVWAAYDETGKLLATFRALEDRSLTDAADESYMLPETAKVGIVHPLELTPEQRQVWLKHLADYDITPPFAQIERPVVLPAAEQVDRKFGNEFASTKLNALTFKGRAERLGWARGSVCDGGGISFYVKTYPGAGVDLFIETDGMYVGIDMYAEVTLGKLFFTRHGSVQVGSYTYDEPSDEKDPRLVAYGQVPPIAFSETMGDLGRISGKSEAPAEAAAT